MTIVLVITAFLCFIGCQMKGENEYFEDYMSLKKTNNVKGIFLLTVFFRHFTQYVKLTGEINSFFLKFNTSLLQLLVTMFLFYSGYGVMESIKKKGTDYIKNIPLKRALKVLINFDIAVLVYLILGLLLGQTYSIKKILLSLVCWESLGNSNWYIMAVVALYLFTYLSFRPLCKLLKKEKYSYITAAVFVTFFSVLYVVVLKGMHRPSFIYNTVLCYPLGIWFSLFKKKFDLLVTKNDLFYFSWLSFALIMFYLFYINRNTNIWYYQTCCLFFVVLIVLITLKIQFDNGLIQFLGTHLFSIYILQRIPMILMSKMYNCNSHPYAFFVISFFVTIVLSLIFDIFLKFIDNKIFGRKKLT